MFCCLECGRKFRTTRAAERAALDGCPGCGGVDIDLSLDAPACDPRQTTEAPRLDLADVGRDRPAA